MDYGFYTLFGFRSVLDQILDGCFGHLLDNDAALTGKRNIIYCMLKYFLLLASDQTRNKSFLARSSKIEN